MYIYTICWFCLGTTLFGKTKLQLVDLSDRPAPIPEEAPRRADLNVPDGVHIKWPQKKCLECLWNVERAMDGHGPKVPFLWVKKFPRNIHGLWCLWWFLLSWSTAKFVHFLPQLDPAAPASFPPGDSWSDPFPSNQTLGPGSKRPLRVDRGTSASFLRPYFPVEHERSSMVQHFVDLPQCFPKWYKIIPCLFGSNISWLVVSTPLKNIRQLFTLFPIII